ncbi:TetR/AcrR family transcriptional regulator [Methylonatrum kenyense]|uniref:TetR/AcrR family transcriptional regulator n=1 Tax=Methylonatrum kenyense TaxID=455253 RepID=UPI0020BE5E11|nr:TetR/AcrR family transcriptional regulator [Methylonatrum kenyense]MCK8515450.1 TetR/AcrR family transcriptional regulator [Methylonatrum kenyense]
MLAFYTQPHDGLVARMTPMNPTRDQIVDAAVELAEQADWESVRLQDVAHRLDCPLQELSNHFREKEELADAWFDRADQAMLRAAADPALVSLPVESRLEHLLFCWLDAMQARHRVTRQMILGKLEPGHIHIQIPSVLRISRTVQWLREAAHCNASGLRRALEETALTSLFVSSFVLWLRDAESGPEQARALFRRGVHGINRRFGWQAATILEALPPAQATSPDRVN